LSRLTTAIERLFLDDPARKIPAQRMVFVFRRHNSTVNQQVEHRFEFCQVFASLFSALDVLLELVGPAEGSYRPRSA
jgi:hypothetical protein